MTTTRQVLIGTACVLLAAVFLRFTQFADWPAAIVGAAVLLGAAGVVGKLIREKPQA
jgi:predicted PurR-regulated permease PerM